MSINRRGVVTADSLHLRKSPNGEIVGFLKNGDPVHVHAIEHTATVMWYRVKPLNKDSGWVAARFIRLDPPLPDVEPPSVPVPDTDFNISGWVIGAIVGVCAIVLALAFL